MDRSLLSLGLVAFLAFGSGAALPSTPTCRSPEATVPDMRRFARLLLDRRDPAAAYTRYASASMIQRNKPFGTDRSSTIRQWQTMTSLPTSRFTITSIRREGDVFTIAFDGQLKPGATATVTQHDRVACGRIIEEWAEFTVHPPASTAR